MAVGATGTPTTNFAIPKYATGSDAPNGSGFNSAMDFIDNLLKEAPMSSKITGLLDGDAVVWDTATNSWIRVTGTKNGANLMRDDGVWHGSRTTYTPTWTSDGTQPAIGNGTITGEYLRLGDLVSFRIALSIGSTTTFGTGIYRYGLPPISPVNIPQNPLGTVRAIDVDGVQHPGFFAQETTSAALAMTASGSYYGPTVPFTWASGDSLRMFGHYWAA